MTSGDPFKEDELLNWPLIRFLNRIAYLKEKNKVIELRK